MSTDRNVLLLVGECAWRGHKPVQAAMLASGLQPVLYPRSEETVSALIENWLQHSVTSAGKPADCKQWLDLVLDEVRTVVIRRGFGQNMQQGYPVPFASVLARYFGAVQYDMYTELTVLKVVE